MELYTKLLRFKGYTHLQKDYLQFFRGQTYIKCEIRRFSHLIIYIEYHKYWMRSYKYFYGY